MKVVTERKTELGVWLTPIHQEFVSAWQRYFPKVSRRERVSIYFTHKANGTYKYTVIEFTYKKPTYLCKKEGKQ